MGIVCNSSVKRYNKAGERNFKVVVRLKKTYKFLPCWTVRAHSKKNDSEAMRGAKSHYLTVAYVVAGGKISKDKVFWGVGWKSPILKIKYNLIKI